MEINDQNNDVFGLENVQFTIALLKQEFEESKNFLNVLKQDLKNRPDIRDLLEPRNSNIADIAKFFEAKILKLEELIIQLTKQTREHLYLNGVLAQSKGDQLVKNYIPALRKSIKYSNKNQNKEIKEEDEDEEKDEEKTNKKPGADH